MSDKNGQTALCFASKSQGYEYTEIVRMLLAAKAEVDSFDNNGITPLLISKLNANTEVTGLLMKATLNKPENNPRYLTWMAKIREENKVGCLPPPGSYVNEKGVTIVKLNFL